jgi:hypothetical protein
MLQVSPDDSVCGTKEQPQHESGHEIRRENTHCRCPGYEGMAEQHLQQSDGTEHPEQKSVADAEQPTTSAICRSPLKQSSVDQASQHCDTHLEDGDLPVVGCERQPHAVSGSG